MFDDRDNCLAEPAKAGRLKRPVLVPAFDHYPAIRINGNAIGSRSVVQKSLDAVARLAGFKIDRLERVEQATNVFVEERPDPIIKAHALPHSVAPHKAAVIDGHLGLVLWHRVSVHPEQDVIIARVVFGVTGGVAVRGETVGPCSRQVWIRSEPHGISPPMWSHGVVKPSAPVRRSTPEGPAKRGQTRSGCIPKEDENYPLTHAFPP